jgi:hypothetical protein
VSAPLPIGTRVTHVNQQWATSSTAPDGTAEILEADGPYPDGSWEYRVRAARDFSRLPASDNPMDRESWWSSNATRVAGGQS